MEIRWKKNGPLVPSPTQTLNIFSTEVHSRQAAWEERLVEDPATFGQVQCEIQQHFNRGADRFVVAILQRATQRPEMQTHVQRVRQNSVTPLKAPERRPRKLRLAWGLIVWLTVLYCPPQSRGAKPSDDPQQPAGLYPELAALGIRHGDCPAVQALGVQDRNRPGVRLRPGTGTVRSVDGNLAHTRAASSQTDRDALHLTSQLHERWDELAIRPTMRQVQRLGGVTLAP